jgi:hypothetical protein
MVRGPAFRLLRLLLAMPLMLPVSLGIGQATAQAYDYCAYWSGNIADSVSATDPGLSGVSYASYVRYTECLDSNLNPTLINVNYFSETVSYTGGQFHQSVQFAVCGTSYPPNHSCGSVVGWTSSTTGGCTGACTVWRGGYVNYTINYDTSAAIFERWAGCLTSQLGDNYCDSFHQFVVGAGYLYSVGYGP